MRLQMAGSAGQLELIIDEPAGRPVGIAMISHPQPLLGGTPRHIVPHSTAQRLLQAGWIAVRPAFRGVGGSEGKHDNGVGEAHDAVVVAAYLRRQYPGLPLALVGFSFGAYVYARTSVLLEQEAPVQAVVLMGLPVGDVPGGRHYEPLPLLPRSFLLHGEFDAMAPLSQVLDWVRPSQHPVQVFPGADHFFKGCLHTALDYVVSHLSAHTDL